MPRPFDAWSPRAKSLARPFATNPYRLLELEPGATPADVSRAVKRLGSGREPVRMVATGPQERTSEQLLEAARALGDPARAGRHTLFLPWLRRLTVDGEALPAALEALGTSLRRAVSPADLAARMADVLLPAGDEAGDEDVQAPERPGGRFFPADLDLKALLGPPSVQMNAKGDDDGAGLLGALGKAPAALAGAVLAATRLGQGRRLHVGYLRTLLAQADGGDGSALRRLGVVDDLFDAIADEPSAPLLLAHRDFLTRKVAAARKRLALAVNDARLDDDERARAEVLLARIEASDARLAGLPGPEAAWARAVFLLAQGELTQAEPELEQAWTRVELQPRLAPLRALVLLAREDLEGAELTLSGLPLDGAIAHFAAAWLAHGRADFERALSLYEETARLQPGHLGAQWGIAVLAADAEVRAHARALLRRRAGGDAALAPALLELALQDGSLDEIATGLERLDGQAPALQVQALDRLGRRAEAWALRDVDEASVRDGARALLQSGQALGALRELAGLSLADPLRRRAARAAIVEALALEPSADPDQVVERILGRVSPEELALLDLPAHLYRAIRELRAGQLQHAVASLRRHLDSADDPLAARLFDVLTAPAGGGFRALSALLGQLLEVDARDLPGLVDAAIDADDGVFEAAVIVAALEGGAFEVGELSDGSPALMQAIALLELRHGLLTADWSLCAEAVAVAERTHEDPLPELERARDALLLARFPESVCSDPALALQALRVAKDDPAALRHDLALWRHFLAIGEEDDLSPTGLAEVIQSWCAASDANALAHPATPETHTLLEDDLLTELAALLGTFTPERAEAARAGLAAIDHPLVSALLARAGWVSRTGGRRRKA